MIARPRQGNAGENYQREQPERVQFGHTNAAIDALLTRYLQAWETDDVDGLVALLKEDATLSMPPVPSWYQGRDALRRVLSAFLCPPGVQRRWRLSPTRANGQPAFVVYRADEATRRFISSKILARDARDNSRRRIAGSVALCTGTETCPRTLIATALADQTITAFEDPFCPAMDLHTPCLRTITSPHFG